MSEGEGDTRGSTRYPDRVDRDEIIRVLRAFEASGLEYVLIGAGAMGFHGLVRATEGLDFEEAQQARDRRHGGH